LRERSYLDDTVKSHQLFVVGEAETGILGIDFMEVGGGKGVCSTVKLFCNCQDILDRHGSDECRKKERWYIRLRSRLRFLRGTEFGLT
jgi:hypothetical protein